VGPSERFAQAVERQKRQYLVSGLSPRAESFRSALEQSTGQTRRPSPRAVSPRA
jgi:hypothetical protein